MPPMRRVARHAFTILAAISLMLCAGVCVLWVRGQFRYDQFSVPKSLSPNYWIWGELRDHGIVWHVQELSSSVDPIRGYWSTFETTQPLAASNDLARWTLLGFA